MLPFPFYRYMKCLAVGMNPNYVLSEDERRRRFKKRNNSSNEKEKTNGVPVIKSLRVKRSEGNLEPRIMPDNEEKSQNEDFKEILEKQKENYYATQVITSTNTEMNDYKKYFLKNEIKYTPNIPASTAAQQGMTNETRDSIIIHNNYHHITKHLGPKKAFLDAEYKNQ